MQPEPNETSKTNSLNSDPPGSPSSTHHGLFQYDIYPPSQLHADEGRHRPRSLSTSRTPSETSSEGSGAVSERSLRGLSGPRQHGGSPVDRVSEHEKALTRSSKKKRGGFVFTVVQRPRGLESPGTGILDFPNGRLRPLTSVQILIWLIEVLTHILSHLPPPSLSDVALVSKRFHELVTAPHAWRSAFSRFFPGAESLSFLNSDTGLSESSDALHSERRFFTRLTPLASWRSEYILRTRLLRSLARGKPAGLPGSGASSSSRSNAGNTASAQSTYNSNLVSTVNHLQANFDPTKKKSPRFIHGTDDLGLASTSDPRLGKVENWGFQDSVSFRQFTDVFPGDAQYGLGAGDCIGVPNVMDISQSYGMVYGEGHQHESVIWYRHLEERRGRALPKSAFTHKPSSGIPQLPYDDATCSVWIAKSSIVPELSDGLIGILAGSSSGALTAYSTGTNGLRDRRIERGEITARWVLCPGVPIVSIVVDSCLSPQRLASRRIFAVILNALGEVFCLKDMPVRPDKDVLHGIDRSSQQAQQILEELAWDAARTVQWILVEPTRRTARATPFDNSGVDGSYSPQNSWNGMYLSSEQLATETKEIESFLRQKPRHFRKLCHGWDMQRRLEVDFAACDAHGSGEALVVLRCGLDEGSTAQIKRYHRCRVEEPPLAASALQSSLQNNSRTNKLDSAQRSPSLCGGASATSPQPSWSFGQVAPVLQNTTRNNIDATERSLVEEWRTSTFAFGTARLPQITCSALDNSHQALLTASEDPLITLSSVSAASSPMSSPLGSMAKAGSSNDVPGYGGRLMAIGTKTGTIMIFNIRSPTASNTIIENTINPIRIIHTDSPQISCLGLTALYIVHGGNDGLVQAWDPLASTKEPIRTLNSRFSSRARRRLIQAEASPAGVGVNLFAAGAICLDPDPTVLRGVVSLGSHLRYWSYSSITADQYKGSKRRPRRSERGSNQTGDRFSGTGRGALKEYIANEKVELEREKRSKREEEKRLAGRFGIDLLGPGASEDEILAYATMLSEEAAQSDELRRKSASEASSSETVTEEVVVSPPTSDVQDGVDEDVAEAIRLSLTGENPDAGSNIAIKYAKKNMLPSPPRAGLESPPAQPLDEDLEYALQLSLAEQESKVKSGKGKEREL